MVAGLPLSSQPAFAIKHEVRGGFVPAILHELGEVFFNALFVDEVVRVPARGRP